jgi:hypothetical protein
METIELFSVIKYWELVVLIAGALIIVLLGLLHDRLSATITQSEPFETIMMAIGGTSLVATVLALVSWLVTILVESFYLLIFGPIF